MNLPIVQSIIFGQLRPKIYIINQNVDGVIKEVQFTPMELWEKLDAEHFFPLVYDGVDENDCPICTPLEYPEEELDYHALANAFAKLPMSLPDIERLCVKELSNLVPFDFEREKPVNIDNVAPSAYTPISEHYFPVDFPIVDYTPEHPYSKFYLNIINAEMVRIKLALLDYAQKIKSDISTRDEVNETVKLMYHYAEGVTNHRIDLILADATPLHEITTEELRQREIEYNIFPILKRILFKTIFEIEILFQPILNIDLEQHLDQMWYKCFKCYPSQSEKDKLVAAIIIQQAQQHIEENDINALESLHPELVRLYPSNSDNPTFLTVFKAVENAIFLGDNTDIQQLVDEKFCKTQFREKKKTLEEEINALTNPREIQSVIEDELDQLDLFMDNNIPFQSIPRRLCSWLTAQLETTKQNLGNIFLPASKNSIEQSPSKQKVSKSSVRDQIKVVKSHLDFLTGYINNEKIMKDDDYENLIQFIKSFLTEKKVPVISARIRTNTTQVFLRYTFYLMYKDLKLKQPSRNAWVSLLHAIFPQFDDTDESVTYKKFSTKPDLYDSDKKSIMASQP